MFGGVFIGWISRETSFVRSGPVRASSGGGARVPELTGVDSVREVSISLPRCMGDYSAGFDVLKCFRISPGIITITLRRRVC